MHVVKHECAILSCLSAKLALALRVGTKSPMTIVQKAVEMIMDRIYDPIFYDFSFGFRGGKSQHDALKKVREKCMSENINWIIGADVSSYFDTIDHRQLIEFMKLRLNDGGLIRLVKKWLNAGAMEESVLQQSETGTPQGGLCKERTYAK